MKGSFDLYIDELKYIYIRVSIKANTYWSMQIEQSRLIFAGGEAYNPILEIFKAEKSSPLLEI